MSKTNCEPQPISTEKRSGPQSSRYEDIKKDAEAWPRWKKDAYNTLATSAHAIKIK